MRLVAALLPLALLVPAAPAAAQEPDGLEVTGWILQSGGDRIVERNAGGISTLSVAGVSIGPGGDRVAAPIDDARRLLRAAHRNGLRAELLVSNYSNRLEDFDPRAAHRLLDDDRHIATVAERLGRFVRQGWDGVNIDLERLRGRDADGLVAFVHAIQDAMPAARTVTIDVSATGSLDGYRDRGYRMRALGEAADTIKLMTYDEHGPTWSAPGPVGSLDWQRRSLEAALDAVPPAKLDLGVAGYGYSWPENGTGRSYTITTIRRMVERDDARPRWVAEDGEWTTTLSNGTELWWSDRRSYAARVDLAREHGLHGLAVWRLGSADTLR
ncbi:glycosyl hydrolase family 18 protein [Nocardioides sp. SR21]|uniref:glycosyl hydrolase family 18 protein n=1 Tax=Nocardioides sp. SR21 TaxID=2919501 RepID=UPI001FAA8DB7|nr:glycosyl hydrolase family 18 protein [Nocardioides sp. SR21]